MLAEVSLVMYNRYIIDMKGGFPEVARKKITSATDQRQFVMVYNDFLESKKLNAKEKLLYIVLKKFSNSSLKSFPSLNTLKELTGISISTIRRLLEHMEELGVLTVEHRYNDVKGNQSNLYTLRDYAALWEVGSSTEELAAGSVEEEEAKMIRALEARGYKIVREKELVSTPTKVKKQALKYNQYVVDTTNNNIPYQDCQDREKYTIEDIKLLYDYDIMAADYLEQIRDIDTVIEILYNAINTTRQTLRINGENKPSMVVIAKLLKLNHMDIMYAINKFQEQTDRIKNPKGYMLTLLYNAKEQMHLDITNQVQHDLYG